MGIVAMCHAGRIDSEATETDSASRSAKRRKQTHDAGTVKAPAAQASRAACEAEYLRLMKKVLPELAKKHKWPIRLDHCFMRVALDNAFGACWYEHLDRKKGPAIRQISDTALQAALSHARAMASDVDGVVVAKFDNNSLRWRGKQPKRSTG